MQNAKISDDDWISIECNLGYRPHNLLDIASRCPINDTPTVLRLYPLRPIRGNKSGEREMFPTLYWLCDESLKIKVSVLEARGDIMQLQERLDTSPCAQRSMQKSHEAYAQERWSLLSKEDCNHVIEKKWDTHLQKCGIAGMRTFLSVKCMHTHLAHYLATGDNVLGKWTQELLENENNKSLEAMSTTVLQETLNESLEKATALLEDTLISVEKATELLQTDKDSTEL